MLLEYTARLGPFDVTGIRDVGCMVSHICIGDIPRCRHPILAWH